MGVQVPQRPNKRIGLRCVATVIGIASFAPVPYAQVVNECFVLLRPGASKPLVSDPDECSQKTAPASTFKIPHALVALELGVITPDTVFAWDGTAHDFEAWRTGHTLDSAMKWSVLPFFQHTARSIGAERMRAGLSSLRYATDTFEREISMFWINGDLVVSPLEQLEFLQRLFSGSVPIAARHVSTVKEAIRMPAGQIVNASGTHVFALRWPSATVVRAKTGNTRVNGEQVSWLVGALELNGIHHVFVARARSTTTLDRTAAMALAVRELNALRPVDEINRPE